jgi:hypothetical protein
LDLQSRKEKTKNVEKPTERRAPYEQGKIDGTWTLERVLEDEATPAQILTRLEAQYLETIAHLQARPGEIATQQIEYWNGLIAAARESLQALM